MLSRSLADIAEGNDANTYLSYEQKEILNYLRQVTGFLRSKSISNDLEYSCIEEFVLKNGCWFENSPLPTAIKRGKRKECARNATRISLDGDYVYVEGFALAPQLIPIFHAWCVDAEGKVIDPTWDYHPGTAYFGVPFNREFVLEIMLNTGYYGILGPGRPYFPLLEGKFADSWSVDGLDSWGLLRKRE